MPKPMQKVVPRKCRNLRKKLWSDLEYVPKEYLLEWFSKRKPLIMSVTYKECYLWRLNSETTCSATTGYFSKMKEGHIFNKKLKVGVGLIYHLSLTKNVDLQIALILIRRIVFGMNLLWRGAINWDLMTSKATLIKVVWWKSAQK